MMTGLDIIKGFASKVVDCCIDITVDKIKEADKCRKVNGQSIETRIYQVMIDALNEFPYNIYKKKEQVYDAAEGILIQFKSDRDDYKEAVRLGLKMLVSQVTGDICEDFLKALCYEICKEKNRDLAIVSIIIQQGQMTKVMHKGFENNSRDHEETHRCLAYVIESIDSIKEDMNRQGGDKKELCESPKRNKAQDYADKWDKNVFLNNFDEEDEIVGVNIKLRDLYKEMCLPHYIWKKNIKPSENTLRELLEKYIMNNQNGEMLLILGQPGIGKSTLITWIMTKLVGKKKDILVYQFATDLKDTNWQGEDMLEEIIKTLRLKDEELKNKILILDGFDEIHAISGRERILNKLSKEVDGKKSLGRFSLIITCRENYVNCSHLSVEHFITLQAWNEEQIKNFCDIYVENSLAKNVEIENNMISEKKLNKLIENKDIFGIPLILYMVLALNITIEESDSIMDIYDQIFSLEGGAIYDRCYDVEHRINAPKIKKHIHRISQRIAFWIFENKADEAVISQKKFAEICEYEMNEWGKKGEEIESDTLIGNFFKLKHCDGEETDTIQFVHRSIYEYFAAIYFFESIRNLKSIEEVVGKLGELLKKGCLSEQILEFIKCKFDKMQYDNLSNKTKSILNIMLRNGMTYFFIKKQKKPFLNIMEWEMNILSNMLDIVHLWNSQLGKVDDKIVSYLKNNQLIALNLRGINWEKANLNGINLRGADLERANLKEADLKEADLKEADLKKANLRKADLRKADLKEADLRKADLEEADLKEADLRETDLRETNLKKADLKEADLEEADLEGANLKGADLRKADLKEVNLRKADLRETDLRGTDLREAGLKGANLNKANLEETYLNKTDLREANLREIDLEKAYLIEACIQGTIFDEKQVNILLKQHDINGIRIYIPKMQEIISYEEYCFINELSKDARGIGFKRILGLFRLRR